MATLRNLAIGLLTATGCTPITQALHRNHLAAYTRPLALLGLTQ